MASSKTYKRKLNVKQALEAILASDDDIFEFGSHMFPGFWQVLHYFSCFHCCFMVIFDRQEQKHKKNPISEKKNFFAFFLGPGVIISMALNVLRSTGMSEILRTLL